MPRRSPRPVMAAPSHLSPVAQEIWPRVLRSLADDGWLDESVLVAVERYCALYARWRAAEAVLATEGDVIKAPKSGVPMQNPHLSIARTTAAELARLERELRLSPARRGFPPHPINADGTPRRSNALVVDDDD